jgi:hypothetical protein
VNPGEDGKSPTPAAHGTTARGEPIDQSVTFASELHGVIPSLGEF